MKTGLSNRATQGQRTQEENPHSSSYWILSREAMNIHWSRGSFCIKWCLETGEPQTEDRMRCLAVVLPNGLDVATLDFRMTLENTGDTLRPSQRPRFFFLKKIKKLKNRILKKKKKINEKQDCIKSKHSCLANKTAAKTVARVKRQLKGGGARTFVQCLFS